MGEMLWIILKAVVVLLALVGVAALVSRALPERPSLIQRRVDQLGADIKSELDWIAVEGLKYTTEGASRASAYYRCRAGLRDALNGVNTGRHDYAARRLADARECLVEMREQAGWSADMETKFETSTIPALHSEAVDVVRLARQTGVRV